MPIGVLVDRAPFRARVPRVCRCSARYRLALVGVRWIGARLRTPTRRIDRALRTRCHALVVRHRGTSTDTPRGNLSKLRTVFQPIRRPAIDPVWVVALPPGSAAGRRAPAWRPQAFAEDARGKPTGGSLPGAVLRPFCGAAARRRRMPIGSPRGPCSLGASMRSLRSRYCWETLASRGLPDRPVA